MTTLGEELVNWFTEIDPDLRHAERSAQDFTEGGKTVLVINSVSRSLVESDFYRLSPQGQHMEGWTSGLTKGMSFSHYDRI